MRVKNSQSIGDTGFDLNNKAVTNSIKNNSCNKNGKIDSFEQGCISDCWLLSGLNAISSTEKGREIIKNSLQYESDGTNVLLGDNESIFVADSELKEYSDSIDYSSGDKDVLIYELAVEKLRTQIASGEIKYNPETPIDIVYDIDGSQSTENILDLGTFDEANYYLAGKNSEYASGKAEVKALIDKFIQNNQKDYALCAFNNDSDSKIVKDANGTKVKLLSEHGYAVKKADKNTVIVSDPWVKNSEIKLSQKTFLSFFSSVTGVDLSDKNQQTDYLISNDEVQIKNNSSKTIALADSSTDEYSYYPNGECRSKKHYNNKGQVEYIFENDEQGHLKSSTSYDYDNDLLKKSTMEIFNDQGTKIYEFTRDFNKGLKKLYTEKSYTDDAQTKYYICTKYDDNGDKKQYFKHVFPVDGNIENIERLDYYPDGKISSKTNTQYYSNGQKSVIDDTAYYENGDINYHQVKSFYSNGLEKKIENTMYDNNGNKQQLYIVEYSENEAAKSQQTIDYYADGTTQKNVEIQYNDNELKTQMLCSYYLENGILSTKEKNYYDDYGSWTRTETEQYDENEQLFCITVNTSDGDAYKQKVIYDEDGNKEIKNYNLFDYITDFLKNIF